MAQETRGIYANLVNYHLSLGFACARPRSFYVKNEIVKLRSIHSEKGELGSILSLLDKSERLDKMPTIYYRLLGLTHNT